MAKIRIAMLRGPRDLRIEEQDLDTNRLGPDEIWVETEVSALSTGTDRGNYEGAERVPGAPDYPRWVGYSNVGMVRGVGSAVTRFQVGDRVFATKPHQSAYIGKEAEMIVKVPQGVPPEQAAFTYLYHLGFFSLRRGQFEPGESVAVVGLGILGLAAVELARTEGARVMALGNDPFRLEVARKIGAHVALPGNSPEINAQIDTLTLGTGIDLVILAANPWPAYRTAVDVVRRNGRVAILSLPGRGEPQLDFNPLELEWFYGKALTIIAVAGQATYAFPTESPRFSIARGCEYLLSLMHDGKIQPARLITHTLPYTRMVEAYEMAYHREKSMIGVLFDWRQG
ncbi:MAG: zinc-binding alcohol dehydrogenase [Chloroflexi bacterium]|nr:zinc-binding alcohol dehydrogenase [Chloroflexota bacterium]